MSKSYRQVDFVSNGWGGGTNYTPAGPIGNQFASPFGDPYRVQATGGIVGDFFSGIGKIITPLLPVAVPIAGTAVAGLLTKSPTTPTQQAPQSQFAVASQQAAAAQAAAAAEKSNTNVHLIVGGVALAALFYFLSRRK